MSRHKKSPLLRGDLGLALLFLDFVTAEVLFRFGKENVFPEDGVVLSEGKFIRGVHRVLFSIILTNTGLFGNEADQLALCITFLSHITSYFITSRQKKQDVVD